MRRIGIFMNLASDDAEGQSRNAAFLQGLQELGWVVGRNVPIDYRWGAGTLDADRMRKDAAELLALAPDVVMARAAPIRGALQQVERTVAPPLPPARRRKAAPDSPPLAPAVVMTPAAPIGVPPRRGSRTVPIAFAGVI